MAIAFVNDLSNNKNTLGFARRATNIPPIEHTIDFLLYERERRIKEALFACDPHMSYAFNKTGNFIDALRMQYRGNVPEEDELIGRYTDLRVYAARIQQGGLDKQTKQELAEFYARTKDPVALQLLMTGYKIIIAKIIAKYIWEGCAEEDRADISQTLSEEVTKALERYDPLNKTRFETYVEKRILGAIKDYFRNNDFLSRTERSHIRAIQKAREWFSGQGVLSPSLQELAEKTDLSPNQLWEASHAAPKTKPLSLDMLVGGRHLHEFIPDEREKADEWEDKRLYDALYRLPERLRGVMVKYFFQDKTELEIGKEFGITESRVSQLKKEGLQKLRKILQK